jgi:hypothetical protein
VQLPFATQFEDSLEILLAPALMALCLLLEFAIGRLSVARSSRHVCPLSDHSLGTTPIAQITESARDISRDRLHPSTVEGQCDSVFELAVDAVVLGQIEELDRLLADAPDLIRRRSAYGHRATLLHYAAIERVLAGLWRWR